MTGVFPAEGPEPGRDWIEWAEAKVRQAKIDAGTYHRTHDKGCWRVHLECAQAEIERLRGQLGAEYEAGVVAGKALAGMGR